MHQGQLNAYVRDVCRPSTGKCCRYLGATGAGFVCLKLGNNKAYLDERVARGTIRAVGDNCLGRVGVIDDEGSEMENPATWTPLHHAINDMLAEAHGDVDTDRALHEAIAVKLGLPVSYGGDRVCLIIAQHHEAIKQHRVGLSLVATLVNARVG